MINAATLKGKRAAAGIPGNVLCQKAGIARTRLSDIERGYVLASGEELGRLDAALDELIEAKTVIDQTAERVGWPTAAGDQHLEASLAERVMHWGVAPDRFLKDGRRWMPRWRFQPTKNLDNALSLLDAADPDECTIARRRGADWTVSIRVGAKVGNAQDALQARAITFAVAQAVGLDLAGCE